MGKTFIAKAEATKREQRNQSAQAEYNKVKSNPDYSPVIAPPQVPQSVERNIKNPFGLGGRGNRPSIQIKNPSQSFKW